MQHRKCEETSKRHLTVVLAVLAYGEVLPALAILKGRKQPKFPEVGVFTCVQAKAWMDEEMELEWIDIVWGQPQKSEVQCSFLIHSQLMLPPLST